MCLRGLDTQDITLSHETWHTCNPVSSVLVGRFYSPEDVELCNQRTKLVDLLTAV